MLRDDAALVGRRRQDTAPAPASKADDPISAAARWAFMTRASFPPMRRTRPRASPGPFLRSECTKPPLEVWQCMEHVLLPDTLLGEEVKNLETEQVGARRLVGDPVSSCLGADRERLTWVAQRVAHDDELSMVEPGRAVDETLELANLRDLPGDLAYFDGALRRMLDTDRYCANQ
jgi:hypothetical protein